MVRKERINLVKVSRVWLVQLYKVFVQDGCKLLRV